MNKPISLFFAPQSFYRGHASTGRVICDRSHVEALFHDDETINDGTSLFDSYAFQIWDAQEHNEYDGTLAQLIWENYQTADYDSND